MRSVAWEWLSEAMPWGLAAGLCAACLNGAYFVFCQRLLKIEPPALVNLVSVAAASLGSNLAGALVYRWLRELTPRPDPVFRFGCVGLTVMTLGGTLAETLPGGMAAPEGFTLLTLPMHLAAGLACAAIVPSMAKRRPTNR
mgnify:CR=1 FL=1